MVERLSDFYQLAAAGDKAAFSEPGEPFLCHVNVIFISNSYTIMCLKKK
jgi:hypothetical protein